MMRITIIFLFLIISRIDYGQQDLFKTHYHQFDAKDEKASYKEYASHKNEAASVASFFFIFYKEFISSQDMNSCVFTPSCSVYAIESVKKLGLIEGLFNSFDRLTRCHPLGQGYYPVDPKTQKFYDPVQEKK